MKDKLYVIGEIINTHGIKGEVKVKQITDFIERFSEGSTVYLKDQSNNIQTLTIETFRLHKHHILLRFKELNTLDEVEPLKGLTLYIKHEQLTELEPGEYYYHEIIGCTVQSTEGKKIGVVDSILAPGANDVWVVKNESGKEYLIPYIPLIVKQVDVNKKIVTIELMEGLLD